MKIFLFILLVVCPGFGAHSWAQEKPADSNKKLKTSHPQQSKNFLIGTEVRNYLYSEPGFISHTGLLFGIWGEWYWQSPLGGGKTYANLLYGALTYDGQACNLSGTVCEPLQATTNDLITKLNTRLEYKLTSTITLFYGAGYRYLYDKGEGATFYTRTGQWVYLPLGISLNMGSPGANFLFEVEYDYTVQGVMKSNLSEVSGVLNDITSNQKGGYGLVLSGGVNIYDNLSAFIIYESWNANDSDVMASGGQDFIEPANNSQSYGVRLGYQF